MTTKITVDPKIFNEVYLPWIGCKSRTQIFFGGSGSGKSVFLAQRCVLDILHGNRNYLVCRQVGRTLRGSCFQEIVKVIYDWNLTKLFTINKSDMLITCVNNFQIIFVGLDDVEKIKSITPAKGAITDIWLEEATEMDRTTVKQLYKRQRGGDERVKKRITLSFNPILMSHWIFQDFFVGLKWADDQTEYRTDDLAVLKTWYVHNRFLTADDKKDLENEKDSYFYNVYTLGNWGVLGNVIFTNWRVEDLSHMRDQFTNYRNGGDFGFSNDPAAIFVSHYDKAKDKIYVYDEFMQKGLSNKDLAEQTKKMIGSKIIRWDSAEPKSIAELKSYGINAVPSKKGRDSVTFGIQWLQRQTIIIDVSCVGMKSEIEQAKWKEDKNGVPLPQPVDRNDHLLSAMRYAYEEDMIEVASVVEDPFSDW